MLKTGDSSPDDLCICTGLAADKHWDLHSHTANRRLLQTKCDDALTETTANMEGGNMKLEDILERLEVVNKKLEGLSNSSISKRRMGSSSSE